MIFKLEIRNNMSDLTVVKRNGQIQPVSFDKITARIRSLASGVLPSGMVIGDPLDLAITGLAQEVIATLKNNISTRELDEHAANICGTGFNMDNADYGLLGGRIAVSNHHKNTTDSLKETYMSLENLVSPLLIYLVTNHEAELESIIDYRRDYRLSYFGFMTLLRSYLLKNSMDKNTHEADGAGAEGTGADETGRAGVLKCERPAHMYLRVSCCLTFADRGTDETVTRFQQNYLDSSGKICPAVLDELKETYDLLSLGYYSHASPTMFNASTKCPQLSSCFLLSIADSLDGTGSITDCWKSCALISKRAGGIGIGFTPIRGTGSLIRGTGGRSNGIVPWLKIFNEISRGVNQGGRRKGSFAIYLEPWHPDIMQFLDIRKNSGKEELRARDLFQGLWIPDLFMARVEQALTNPEPTVKWSLICPDRYPELVDLHSKDFEERYLAIESSADYVDQVDILDIWKAILSSQKETGTPYMLYKDSINRKNNQQNLGTIRNSNLCAEIVEWSGINKKGEEEQAVCNLASIVLNKFVKNRQSQSADSVNSGTPYFDFEHLGQVVRQAFKNLDRVIDVNYYPTSATRRSNYNNRPVGLGVQGLADVYILMGYPFESPQAMILNREIFETIYYHCLQMSNEIAIRRAQEGLAFLSAEREVQHGDQFYRPDDRWTYRNFINSPLSKGKFQFDLWGDRPSTSLNLDWSGLRKSIVKYGVRNSLTTAVMPTATTAHILGNNECIEPYNYNIYTRRVLSGEFTLVNPHLQRELQKRGLWTKSLKEQLIRDRGSVQNITTIPEHLRELFKTAFEIKQRVLVDQARDRAPFIDQTQSFNLFFPTPTSTKLSSAHIYGWKRGLKTGMYYLRREQVRNALQVTVRNEQADADCTSCSA